MFRPRTFYGLTKGKMKFDPDPVILDWGNQGSTYERETGIALGADSMETIDGESYYKVVSGGRYTLRKAILNFKTTSDNQNITITVIKYGCSIVYVGNLDSDSNDTYHTKLDKGEYSYSYQYENIKIAVPTAGDHFVKISIRSEGDGLTSDNVYFRLTPYEIVVNAVHPVIDDLTINSYRKEWYILSQPYWIQQISPNNGGLGTDRNESLMIVADANLGLQRNGNIVFKDGNGKEYNLQVIQRASDIPQVILSRNSIELDKERIDYLGIQIQLINNTKWTLTGLPSWITVTESFNNIDALGLSIQENTTGVMRTATLTFTGDVGGSQTLKITQDHLVNICPAQGGCICYHDNYCASDCPSYRACTCNSENCYSNCICDEGCTCNNDLVSCKGYNPAQLGTICQPQYGGTICSNDCYNCQSYCDAHSCGCNYRDVISPVPCTGNSCVGYEQATPCTCNAGHCGSYCACDGEVCCGCDGWYACTCDSFYTSISVMCTCDSENCSCDGYVACTCDTQFCSCNGYTPASCLCQGVCNCDTQCPSHCIECFQNPCSIDGNSSTCPTQVSICDIQCASNCPNNTCSNYFPTCNSNCTLETTGLPCSCNQVCETYKAGVSCTCENVCNTYVAASCTCDQVCSQNNTSKSCTCEMVCTGECTCNTENCGCDGYKACTCDSQGCDSNTVPCSANYCDCNSETCASDTCKTYCNCDINQVSCPSNLLCSCNSGYVPSSCTVVNCSNCPSYIACSCDNGSIVRCPSYIATQGSYCTPQCYSDTYCDCYNYISL